MRLFLLILAFLLALQGATTLGADKQPSSRLWDIPTVNEDQHEEEGYIPPWERDGLLALAMPDHEIPERIHYDAWRHPVRFVGCQFEAKEYGFGWNTFHETTYGPVFRVQTKSTDFDFAFPRLIWEGPGAGQTHVESHMLVGFTIMKRFR